MRETHEMDLRQALAILTRRRHKDLLDAIDAADLFSALLNVLREDVYANQILDIKSHLQLLVKKGPPSDAMDLERRPQTHQKGLDSRQTEAMGGSSEQRPDANRGRGASDSGSQRRNITDAVNTLAKKGEI
jgi:hypothetical protein